MGRPIPSARGFELVGGFGVGVVRRVHFPGHPSARGFELVGGFVVGGVRRICFPGRARCGGRGNRIVGARLPPLHPVTGEAVEVAPWSVSSLAHVVVNLCVPWLLAWHVWCAVLYLSVFPCTHRSIEGNVPPPLVAAWWVVAAALSLIWSQDSAQAMVVLSPQNTGRGLLRLGIGIKDALVELAVQDPFSSPES